MLIAFGGGDIIDNFVGRSTCWNDEKTRIPNTSLEYAELGRTVEYSGNQSDWPKTACAIYMRKYRYSDHVLPILKLP